MTQTIEQAAYLAGALARFSAHLGRCDTLRHGRRSLYASLGEKMLLPIPLDMRQVALVATIETALMYDANLTVRDELETLHKLLHGEIPLFSSDPDR